MKSAKYGLMPTSCEACIGCVRILQFDWLIKSVDPLNLDGAINASACAGFVQIKSSSTYQTKAERSIRKNVTFSRTTHWLCIFSKPLHASKLTETTQQHNIRSRHMNTRQERKYDQTNNFTNQCYVTVIFNLLNKAPDKIVLFQYFG